MKYVLFTLAALFCYAIIFGLLVGIILFLGFSVFAILDAILSLL